MVEISVVLLNRLEQRSSESKRIDYTPISIQVLTRYEEANEYSK